MSGNDTVKVAFYYGMNKREHLLDKLTQPEVGVAWEPGLADIQQRNIERLMAMANISPMAWRDYLVGRFQFDVLAPTEQGLSNMGVPQERLRVAMDMAREQRDNWDVSPIEDLWAFDPDAKINLTPDQIYEVLAESRGRGTPAIIFQAEEENVIASLSEDNQITLDGPVYIGLTDPVNGLGWSPRLVTGPVTFRPSAEGVVVLGDHYVFEDVVDDAYSATVSFEPGEPLQLSTRSTERSRLGPPIVRDERRFEQVSEPTRGFGL